MKTQSRLGALLCAFFVATTISIFGQGSLTPSAAPTPTMKTLDQVEARIPLAGGTSPIIVGQSGSYYLTGNVSITSGSSSNGINIYVSNVTIDLNGFEVAGSGATSGVGVVIAGGESNITVRNGTIRNWGSHGINGAGNPKLRVENLRVLNNGGNGILADVNAEVINCLAQSNVGYGISVLDYGIVKDCQVIATTGSSVGIAARSGSTLTNCASNNNTGEGIFTVDGCVLTNCTVSYNTSFGFSCHSGDTLTNCTASNNGAEGFFSPTGTGLNLTSCSAQYNRSGFYGFNDSTFTKCSATQNSSDGFTLDSGCVLVGCVASSNGGPTGIEGSNGTSLTSCTARGNGPGSTSVTDSAGIYVGDRSSVIGCTSSENISNSNANTGTGIVTNGNSTIRDCTVGNNDGDGIRVGSGCVVLNNTCESNGSGATSGIHATGIKNRIEGNAAVNNPTGFKVDAAGNLIIKNSNTGGLAAFTLAAGNSVGDRIDVWNGGSGANITSTNPWANFLY